MAKPTYEELEAAALALRDAHIARDAAIEGENDARRRRVEAENAAQDAAAVYHDLMNALVRG
jgi:hypothetical protein